MFVIVYVVLATKFPCAHKVSTLQWSLSLLRLHEPLEPKGQRSWTAALIAPHTYTAAKSSQTSFRPLVALDRTGWTARKKPHGRPLRAGQHVRTRRPCCCPLGLHLSHTRVSYMELLFLISVWAGSFANALGWALLGIIPRPRGLTIS